MKKMILLAAASVTATTVILACGGYGGTEKSDFISPERGFAVRYGQALHTHDAGKKWETITLPGNEQGELMITDLQVHESGMGFISGADASGTALFRTTNSGETWVKISAPAFKADAKLVQPDGNHLIVYSSANEVAVTEDAGLTWEQYTLNESFGVVNKISMSDAQRGFAISYVSTDARFEMHLLVTRNGGRTWTDTGIPKTGSTYADIAALPDGSALFLSEEKLFRFDGENFTRIHGDAGKGMHIVESNERGDVLLGGYGKISVLFAGSNGFTAVPARGSISNLQVIDGAVVFENFLGDPQVITRQEIAGS